MRSRPTLSLAITTRGPVARVRALLELMRPHVDEVVLAVDRDGDREVLDTCRDLADQRLLFELRDSPARLVGWIQHECRGDWILRLDDDEVPSAALLRALPEMIADPRLSEFAFHRRWLVDSVERWIDSPPWRTDYQGRLRRNVPGLWTFSGSVHTDGDTRGERRFVSEPIYHCDLLLTGPEERLTKSRRYEAEVPGITWEGFALNLTYLPERFEDLSTAGVDHEDLAALRAVVDPAPAVAAHDGNGNGAAAPVRELTFAEIDRFNTSVQLGESALLGGVEWISPPAALPAGTAVHHDVRVCNLGDALWRLEAIPPTFQVGVRIRDVADNHLVSDHLEPFTETVWPGAESILLIPVRTPAQPGQYSLELDLVYEGRRFGDGSRHALTVLPAQPAEANGSLDAMAEASRSARALADAERRRREYERAAAELQDTRRYRVLNALTRPVSRRPPREDQG